MINGEWKGRKNEEVSKVREEREEGRSDERMGRWWAEGRK